MRKCWAATTRRGVIAATPLRLSRVLDRLSAEEIETRPAPGKWNVRELTAHLADCEVTWSWRLRQAYGEEHARMQPFDQDAWARTYAGYSLADARATFAALRTWNIVLIGFLRPADRVKPITHPERGEETLWTLVRIMAGHDLHHLQRLEGTYPHRPDS